MRASSFTWTTALANASQLPPSRYCHRLVIATVLHLADCRGGGYACVVTLPVEVSSGKSRRSTAAERAVGLAAVALAGGRCAHASELCGVPESTLYAWRHRHPAEYEAARAEVAPRIERLVIGELREFVVLASCVKRLALQRTMEALEAREIPARDLPRALQAITTAEAISIDKVLALSGRPSQIVHHRSGAALVQHLARLGAVVDGSAVELPAAD